MTLNMTYRALVGDKDQTFLKIGYMRKDKKINISLRAKLLRNDGFSC